MIILTFTNKVKGARDKTNFAFIELIYLKKCGEQKLIISPLVIEIKNGQFSGQATLTNKFSGARITRVILWYFICLTEKFWEAEEHCFSTSSWWLISCNLRHDVVKL